MRFGRPNAHKRTLPNVFNKKQLIALFENLSDSSIFMGAMIALFCGLRISEVCNLKKQDIDLEAEKVAVRQGKGSKDRVVMLPSSLKPIMEKWFRYNKKTEFYICNEYRSQYSTGLLSRKFKEALERAKLKIATFKTSVGQQRYAYSFHTLRHTYATNLARSGVHPKIAMDLLDHSDINLTMAYYSHTDVKERAEALGGLPSLVGE